MDLCGRQVDLMCFKTFGVSQFEGAEGAEFVVVMVTETGCRLNVSILLNEGFGEAAFLAASDKLLN